MAADKKPWEMEELPAGPQTIIKPWEMGEMPNAQSTGSPAAPANVGGIHRHGSPTLMDSLRSGMAEGAHPTWDKLTEYREPDFTDPSTGFGVGTMVGNLGGRTIKAVGDMFLPGGTLQSAGHGLLHPQESAKSLVESVSGQKYDPSNPDIFPDARKAVKTGTDLVAQGGALGPVVDAVPGTLKSVGKGIRKAGDWAGEATLGTDAVDRATAQPGAGVSRNRVVALSRPSLLNKVKGKIGGLKAQEADLLENTPGANQQRINARDIIQKPFDETIARTTNYRTGAGDPAQLRAHFKADQALSYVQDPTSPDGLLRDPVSQQPVPMQNTDLSPLETSNLKSNMYRMADYDTAESTLANQDIKLGAAGLKNAIQRAVPEAAEATEQLHNTEAAADVLQKQRGLSLQGNTPFSRAKLVDAVRVPAGSAIASGLDLVGSGVEGMGEFLRPTKVGGGPVRSSSNPPAGPQGPTIAGQLPTPPQPVPQGQPALGSGHIVTPPPAPVAGGLPGNVQGPLTRVVTRTGRGFGPKVAAPAFNMPVGYGSIMRPTAELENAGQNIAAGNPGKLTDAIKNTGALTEEQVMSELAKQKGKNRIDMEHVTPEDIQESIKNGMSLKEIVDNYIMNEQEYRRLGKENR